MLHRCSFNQWLVGSNQWLVIGGHDSLAITFTCSANVQSSGFLSSRNPMNTGARNFRPPSSVSWVHSENFTSATNTGFTQCAFLGSTGPVNGFLLVSISFSATEICFKVA